MNQLYRLAIRCFGACADSGANEAMTNGCAQRQKHINAEFEERFFVAALLGMTALPAWMVAGSQNSAATR
jgi:hypothetical protein